MRVDLLGVPVPKVAGRFGANDDHVQRDQQTGAGEKRQETSSRIVHRFQRKVRFYFGELNRRVDNRTDDTSRLPTI